MLAFARMRKIFILAAAMSLLMMVAGPSWAADFKLNNGDVVRGETSRVTDDGVVVRLSVGGFSPVIGWGKLSQETLHELVKDPAAKEFAEPFIDIPLEQRMAQRKKPDIHIKEAVHPEIPAEKTRFFSALLSSGMGIFILILLYGGNLFAAYEIALFKARPTALVCGLAAVIPFFGPALFLMLPGAEESHVGSHTPAAVAPDPVSAEVKGAMGQSSLGLAAAGGSHAQQQASGNPNYTTVWDRNNATFDRRFFETKFAGYFRVVLGEQEKSLLLVIKTAKREYVAQRISRISMTELHLMLQGGQEAGLPFGEIVQIATKPK